MKWFVFLFIAGFLCLNAFAQAKAEQVTEQKPVTAEEKAAPAKDSAAPPVAPPAAIPAPPAANPAQPPAGTAQPQPQPAGQEVDITPLIKTVKLNFKEGKFEAADKAVDMALGLKPNDFDAVKYKAMIALKLGKMDIAEQQFNLALTAGPKDAEFDFYLGGFYGKKGDFLSAEKRFLRYTEYGITEPYREKLRRYADYVRPKADRARAKLLLDQEAAVSATAPPQNSVAVTSFANTSTKKDLDPLQKGLAEMMITDLSQVSRLKVIERVQMQALVDEMALGQTGLLEEKNTDRLGKLLSAEKVVSGSYSSDDKGNLTLSGSLSFSATQGVTSVGPVSGKLSDLFKLEKDLVFKTVREMGIVPTESEKKKIEVIPTENVLAFLAFSKGLDAEDRGDFSAAAAGYSDAVKLDPGFSKAQAALTSAAAISDMGKPAAGPAPAPPIGISGAGEITTPVFTLGGLNFSATGNVSLYAINAVSAAFMPEKALAAGPLRPTPAAKSVADAQANNGRPEDHTYIDAFNVGLSSGATTVNARVPIPQQ
jgi:TolB-like protein